MLVLILASFVSVACAAGAFFYVKEMRKAEEERQRAEALALYEAEFQEVQALFDTYINNFISDLKVAMRDYRETRLVLPRMVAAYNFETPDYAKENYSIFVEDIAPSLREKANNVLQIFARYEQMLKKDLGGRNSKIEADFSKRWQEMSDEQLEIYVNYFMREEELIGAYDNLMRFYVRYSNLYTIDPDDEVFVFKREEDKARHLALLENLGQAAAANAQ